VNVELVVIPSACLMFQNVSLLCFPSEQQSARPSYRPSDSRTVEPQLADGPLFFT